MKEKVEVEEKWRVGGREGVEVEVVEGEEVDGLEQHLW